MGPEEPGSPPDELRARVAELERSAERLSTILEHAPVMIDSFDENGRCVLWNRQCEKTLGWTQQEVAACADPLSLFYPEASVRDQVLQTIGRADGRFREYRVQAKDGSSHVQMWANFELPTAELISVGHDISDQRALEEQLRQSHKLEAIGRLSGGVAHDFNNLLTVVMGNMELIAAGLPADQEALHELIAQVQGAARRGARLTRNLLTFSRSAPLAQRSVEPARVVGEAVRTLRRLLPESVEIELQAEEDLPMIEADPDAVEQILMNLGTNARDAMPGGGRLGIELRLAESDDARPGKYVSLAVRDSGSGMAGPVREMAFEPFFTTKPAEEGSGLGLSIVYGLMKQHRGFATLTSKPGIGTTVTVSFPVGAAAAPASEAAVQAVEPPGGSETVLVAEDETSIRDVARSALEGHGYTVLLAADGEQALDLLRRHDSAIDLVVADLVMPRLGGSELCSRAQRLAPTVRFLLTTGYADRDVPAMRVEGAGEVPLLQKPWTVQELRARVREVLDS